LLSPRDQVFRIGTAISSCSLTFTLFQGQLYAAHLLCERDSGRNVVGVPAQRCAFWELEPGADDEWG
jgi:hypothetical protein